MQDMVDFLEEQIRQDLRAAQTKQQTREAAFKQAIFDTHRPRYDGQLWVCDSCAQYDGMRKRMRRAYAPCDQLTVLLGVYEEREGFDPEWGLEDDEDGE